MPNCTPHGDSTQYARRTYAQKGDVDISYTPTTQHPPAGMTLLYQPANVVRRLTKAFTNRTLISEFGLQYRLCEVGPSSKRFDPRLVDSALSQLDARQLPKMVVPGLLAKPDALLDETQAETERGLDAAQTLSTVLNRFDPTQLLNTLIPSRSLKFGKTNCPQIEELERGLIDTIVVPTQSLFTKAIVNARVVQIWVLNDLAWLYPDDHRLWRILLEGARNNTPTLIIARAIARLTFPLLKAVGARGTQFYGYLCRGRSTVTTNFASDLLGLPHFTPLTRLRPTRFSGKSKPTSWRSQTKTGRVP
jgi:hypothetical protein